MDIVASAFKTTKRYEILKKKNTRSFIIKANKVNTADYKGYIDYST